MKNQNVKDSYYSKRIKKLRDKKNWSQRDLAKEFGVSAGAVAHWESGTREVSGPIRKLVEIYEDISDNRDAL